MVVDVVRRIRRRRDMDRPHAKRMGDSEVSRVILEHGGGPGVQAVQREDGGKGRGVGLGVELGVFDPVDRVEKPAKSTGGKDFFRLGRTAVGVDDLATW